MNPFKKYKKPKEKNRSLFSPPIGGHTEEPAKEEKQLNTEMVIPKAEQKQERETLQEKVKEEPSVSDSQEAEKEKDNSPAPIYSYSYEKFSDLFFMADKISDTETTCTISLKDAKSVINLLNYILSAIKETEGNKQYKTITIPDSILSSFLSVSTLKAKDAKSVINFLNCILSAVKETEGNKQYKTITIPDNILSSFLSISTLKASELSLYLQNLQKPITFLSDDRYGYPKTEEDLYDIPFVMPEDKNFLDQNGLPPECNGDKNLLVPFLVFTLQNEKKPKEEQISFSEYLSHTKKQKEQVSDNQSSISLQTTSNTEQPSGKTVLTEEGISETVSYPFIKEQSEENNQPTENTSSSSDTNENTDNENANPPQTTDTTNVSGKPKDIFDLIDDDFS